MYLLLKQNESNCNSAELNPNKISINYIYQTLLIRFTVNICTYVRQDKIVTVNLHLKI